MRVRMRLHHKQLVLAARLCPAGDYVRDNASAHLCTLHARADSGVRLESTPEERGALRACVSTTADSDESVRVRIANDGVLMLLLARRQFARRDTLVTAVAQRLEPLLAALGCLRLTPRPMVLLAEVRLPRPSKLATRAPWFRLRLRHQPAQFVAAMTPRGHTHLALFGAQIAPLLAHTEQTLPTPVLQALARWWARYR